jgi:hypothetical protein
MGLFLLAGEEMVKLLQSGVVAEKEVAKFEKEFREETEHGRWSSKTVWPDSARAVAMPLSDTFRRLKVPETDRAAIQLTAGDAFCYPLYYFIPSFTLDAEYLIYHRAEKGEVQPAFALAQPARQTVPCDRVTERAREQFGLSASFDKIVLGSVFDRLHGKRVVGVPGQNDDRQVADGAAEGVQSCQPGGIRQAEIQQDNVERLDRQAANPVSQVGCRLHPKGSSCRIVQRFLHDTNVVRVILDHQDVDRLVRPNLRPGAALAKFCFVGPRNGPVARGFMTQLAHR